MVSSCSGVVQRIMSDEHGQASTESSRASSDPLSGATRALKRNLLLASVVAIAFKAFKVSVDHISLAGISANFDRGVFEFLIILSLLYFLVTFCLYYYIDISNLQETDHQARTASWKNSRRREFMSRYWEETDKLVRQLPLPSHSEIYINQNYLHVLQRTIERPSYPSTMDYLKESGAVPLHGDERIDYITLGIKPSGTRALLPRSEAENQIGAEREAAMKLVDEIAIRRAKEFPKHLRLHSARLLPRLIFVRGAYVIRNYGTDGILPVFFAISALCVMYNIFDPAHLMGWLPPEARPTLQ